MILTQIPYLALGLPTGDHSDERRGKGKNVPSHIVAVLSSKVQPTRRRGDDGCIRSKDRTEELFGPGNKGIDGVVAHLWQMVCTNGP